MISSFLSTYASTYGAFVIACWRVILDFDSPKTFFIVFVTASTSASGPKSCFKADPDDS